MKRRFKTLLFALVAMAMPLVASAEKVEIGGIWYNLTAETHEAEVTKSDGTEYSGSITLTATVTYDGVAYSVTSIGDWAFYSCTSLTAITIPKGVTSIGNHAFYGCRSLTDITIPEGVTSIGDQAFKSCKSFTNITIPKGVTSIGGWAFDACSNLTAITIPEGVTSIGNYAFLVCSSLTAITIPESVTSIGNRAFNNCSSLTSIVVAKGNKVYDSRGDCNAIIETNSNTLIQGCATTTIPEGVTSIGDYAFDGFRSLTDITIPEGVTSIGSQAFWDCSSLTAITIPEGVTSIGDEAFYNCSSLTDVYCHAATVPSTETNAFSDSNIENATLHVPASAVNSYKTTAPWSSFGKVETLKITVDEITLSQSAAELIEGESLQLTATVSPDDATDKTVTWSSSDERIASVDANGVVTAVAAGTATITATANDGSEVSAQCEVTVNELLGKCATPTISYTDGKVVLTCATEGAKVITDVVAEDAHTYEDLEFTLSATYTLSAYATKEYYENSDTVTLTICWVPCDKNHEGGTTDVLTIPAKPVLIQCQGGVITVSGLADGTAVAAYSTAGTELATATATNGTATLTTDLTAGTIAIVKTGDYSIKIAIK